MSCLCDWEVPIGLPLCTSTHCHDTTPTTLADAQVGWLAISGSNARNRVELNVTMRGALPKFPPIAMRAACGHITCIPVDNNNIMRTNQICSSC